MAMNHINKPSPSSLYFLVPSAVQEIGDTGGGVSVLVMSIREVKLKSRTTMWFARNMAKLYAGPAPNSVNVSMADVCNADYSTKC